MKKVLATLLACVLAFSAIACGGSKPNSTPTPTQSAGNTTTDTPAPKPTEGGQEQPGNTYVGPDWTKIDAMDHDEASDAVYEYNLGVFNEYYQKAKAEITNLDLRLALMAIAEAKLMESGVFIPVYGDGGNYAMTRVVPRSICTTSWGIDEYKWHTMLVTNELITNTDRDALIGIWGAAADEDAYIADAKKFLAEHGYTLTDTYNFANSYEIATWDVIATSFTSDSYFISCTYSPLLQYDNKGVQRPAMATSVDVSADGTVYTFHIREGVNWVDQQGRVLGEVTANDWVASMKHLVDNNDALGYLMSKSDGCGIKGYDDYINGDITDFSEVGVKAVDKYTLQYTLEAPFPAFLSMMGYACFAPLNESFYKSQGGTFSADGDEYTAGNYGTSPANIAYNGAYLVSNFTEKNIISYKPNEAYFAKEKVNTPYVNWYFNDGSDTLRSYNEAKEGTIAGAGFNSEALVLAKTEKPAGSDKTYFELYNYTTTNSATTYCGWVNLNRGTWANFNDNTIGVSSQTDEMKARTREALNNTNFRMAMAMAFDRGAYNSTIVGEDLKYAALKNSYVTGNFQVTTAEVTVDINGKATTFPAGTYFGVIEQAQLDADGCPIKVWDPAADGGAGSGDGFDGWYSVENAQKYLAAAIEELKQIGVEISKENPIHIDAPTRTDVTSFVNRMQVYKQSIEKATNGMVVIDLVEFATGSQMQYAYYRTSNGSESNYDITPGTSGWGPDYGDAQTFLDTIQPYGYMTKNIGLY